MVSCLSLFLVAGRGGPDESTEQPARGAPPDRIVAAAGRAVAGVATDPVHEESARQPADHTSDRQPPPRPLALAPDPGRSGRVARGTLRPDDRDTGTGETRGDGGLGDGGSREAEQEGERA